MARITTQSGYSPEQPILAENLDFISHISISLITKTDQITTKLYLALLNAYMQVSFRPLSNRSKSLNFHSCWDCVPRSSVGGH